MKTSLLPASGMIPQDPSMHGGLISGENIVLLDIQYMTEEEISLP